MFVFPMLGKSSRFYNAGYTLPKYKLPLGEPDQIVFDHVIMSFRRYFESDRFVLICRADANDRSFIIERMHHLGVLDFKVIAHHGETNGQAESVELAVEAECADDELFIFNIDTLLYAFEKGGSHTRAAGYLEVFKGEGDHWSFVFPDSAREGHAAQVTEKVRVSDLCSNGLYYFHSVDLFRKALYSYRIRAREREGEIYVAPLYNELIAMGLPVLYKTISIEDIGFCGVPDEYKKLLEQFSQNM